MDLLPHLLGKNNKLLKHATKTLSRAVEHGDFLAYPDYRLHEQLFFQTYLALREVEIRGLHLLHEMTVLAQMLQREEAARKTEEKLEKTFREQERGNGKKAVIISPQDLKKQEKMLKKDRKLVQESIEHTVEAFLQQHESLVQTARLLQKISPTLVLLHPRTDRKILKAYARAGGKPASLLQQVRADVGHAQPLDLAERLLDQRSTMRRRLTELSNARRQFAGFIHHHLPMIAAV